MSESTSKQVLDGLLASLRAVTDGRVVSQCGHSFTVGIDLSGRVRVGDDLDGSDLQCAVQVGDKFTTASNLLGQFSVSRDFHVYVVAPADSDDGEARIAAAEIAEASIVACLVDDRNNATRLGAVQGVDIKPSSGILDGGADHEDAGVVYILLRCTWVHPLGI